jgi:outer membrane protein OmpA-like peptidoglycan-associated protein
VQAEQQFRAAETDPVVTANAPLLLEDARQALERGQRAWRNGADEDEVDHLAYLAARRVEIARLSAQRRADVERADELSREVRSRPALALAPPASVPLHPSSIVEDIHFDSDRTTLPEGSRAELAHAADWITAHPGVAILVEGHADATERESLTLSVQRAEQVAQELVALGVDPDRITLRALGAGDPVASSATASGRQRNRRVEIVVSPVVSPRFP